MRPSYIGSLGQDGHRGHVVTGPSPRKFPSPSIMSPKDSKPLPLSDTLRDLALLRVSDINLSSLLSTSSIEQPPSSESKVDDGCAAVEASVERSYEFVREARSAVRMHSRGDVDTLGDTVNDVRCRIEEVLRGLDKDESG